MNTEHETSPLHNHTYPGHIPPSAAASGVLPDGTEAGTEVDFNFAVNEMNKGQLEAMAAEVPVISTNAGGLPEININGFSGFMSNVGDIEDMSKNAISILSDPLIHQEFKTNAFTQAKRFGINSIVPQYEALYERVMGRKV
jgi:glycosyltransferase involved in cell wall biosynthesis